MTFRIQPLQGILRPVKYRYQLKTTEEYKGYKRFIAILFILSLCTYGISAAFGIGTETLSKGMNDWTGGELEARKQLFFVGRLILGLLIPGIFLFLGALYYWCFSSIEYKKLVIVQMTVFSVYLFEQLVQIPMFVLMDIDAVSNPFSLGVIAQYLTNKELIIHFLSEITLFQVGMIAMTIYYLRELTELTKKQVISIVIFFFMILWFLSGLLSYIKISIFF
ncbi:MAG: hypothetical protein ACI35R_17845 [Bacillus sp. (in: firmicutes)]